MGVQLELKWDDSALTTLNGLMYAHTRWENTMHKPLAQDLAKVAEDYMRPLMHVRPFFTGALEDSLKSTVTIKGDGWEVGFEGLDYGNWVDVGQDYDVLYASQYGYKFFPVDRRFGAPFPAGAIHAIGKSPTSPYDVPLKFSEKTLDYLANGKAVEIGEKYLSEFLDTVVIR